MKKLLSLATALIMTLTLCFYIAPSASAATSFPDVPSSHWAYPYVSMLTGNGAVGGNPDGTFAPSRNISVAEFVKILTVATLGDIPTVDNPQHWAESYIKAAFEYGIIVDGEYPAITWDNKLTRQEMARMIARAAANALKEPEETDTDALTSKIKDWDTTCESCKPFVAQTYAKGIILGIDGSFYGAREATRAEATTMVVRLIDKAYRYTYIDGVPFCAKTDVTDEGLMKIASAERWIKKTLETLKFYKEGGKYYFTVTLPEVPEGFEMNFSFDMYPSTTAYRTNAYVESQMIPSIGTIIKELPAGDMPAVFQNGTIGIGISVNQKPTKPLEIREDGGAGLLAIYKDGKLEKFSTWLDYTGGGYTAKSATDMKLNYSDYFGF